MLFRILSRLPRWLAPAALAVGLVACGGSSSVPVISQQGCSASSCGNALLTLTDAAGDFASYAVDVASLKLTKADGTSVETLPTKTRVDFTQLVNVTEFIASAAIPQGDYVSATMTLDYANAAIFVYTDANNTQTAQVAKVLDTGGNTIYLLSATPPVTPSTVTVTVQLDNKNHLVINPGKLARLALDFNVAASNSVDLTDPTAPIVQVKAFIVASVVPTDSKQVRVRGALLSTDVGGESYTLTVEPFDDEGTDRGQLVVHTTAQTSFEVDGTAYTGDAGLTALGADPAGTMTVAFGTLSGADHSFTASRVLGGTSVETNSLDRLQGVVISRTGNTLVVRGGSMWQHSDDQDHFSAKDVTLTIADTTAITIAGQVLSTATPVSPLSLPSVGSRITAFGKAGKDGSGNLSFDASNGRLRIELTTLWGTATQIGTGSVTLSLQAIEGRAASAFNFAGTGATSAQDSNPASYVVTTGALPLATLSASAPLRFFGHVQRFGAAPPDFNAQTLVDFTDTSALLEASFGAGSTAALTASAANLVLNVGDPLLGWLHFIRVGPQLIDLKSLLSNVTIAPAAASTGPFAIHTDVPQGMGQPDTIAVFNTYADFEAALATRLAAGAKVLKVFALGHYDAGTNTFTAAQIALDVM